MSFLRRLTLAFFVTVFLPVNFLFASETDGTIISPNTNARGYDNNMLLINLGTAEGNVHVTDSALTGYAWGEVVGWINLDPSTAGVDNDGEGNLSGYAWGEWTGWINFDSTNSGVTIDENGDFHGYAWAQNFGWIAFNCADPGYCSQNSHKVNTDWRPQSARDNPECDDDIDNDSDGDTDFPDDDGCDSASDDSEASSGGSTGGDPGPGPGPDPGPGPTPTPEPDPEPGPIPPGPPPDDIEPPGPPPITPTPPDEPPVPGPIERIFVGVVDQITDSAIFLRDTIVSATETIKEVINTPAGSIATKAISTLGILTGGLATASTLFLSPLTISELVLLPFRLWALLLSFLGLKKKYKPWGTVYDSMTKQPLDPAYVVLQDENGKELDTSITDLDGRYGFLINKGKYRLVANKSDFTFPSTKMAGRTEDELYDNLYFGEMIEVTEDDAVIARNIPMDSVSFNWNEFAKRDQKLMLFYGKYDRFIARASGYIFGIGFVIATVALFAAPQPYNIIAFALYILMLVLRIFGLKPKQNGLLIDGDKQVPLSFAKISVFIAELNAEIIHKTADAYGRYFCLVPKGKYYVRIEKKIPDGGFELIYQSKPFEVKKGIINQTFTITEADKVGLPTQPVGGGGVPDLMAQFRANPATSGTPDSQGKFRTSQENAPQNTDTKKTEGESQTPKIEVKNQPLNPEMPSTDNPPSTDKK